MAYAIESPDASPRDGRGFAMSAGVIAVVTITLRDELIEALTYAWHSLRKAEGEGRATAAIRELIDDLLDDLHEVG